MTSNKNIDKIRPFKELSEEELRLIFDGLVAYKYLAALRLVDFYKNSFATPRDFDFEAEDIQKANLLWPDDNGFFDEIMGAISIRREKKES